MQAKPEEAPREPSGARPPLDSLYSHEFFAEAPPDEPAPPSSEPSARPPPRRARRYAVKLLGWSLFALVAYGVHFLAGHAAARDAILDWGSLGHPDEARALTGAARRVGEEVRQRARALADRAR